MGLLTAAEIERLDTAVQPYASRIGRKGLGTLLDDLDQTVNPSGGIDYFVNSNLAATAGTGYTWDTAFKTLSEAMAVSHAAIASGRAYWAAMNRIFYKGDSNTEVLTTLAQKTYIIGVGSGGGHRSMPCIVGEHIIGAVAYVSCVFVHMGFMPATNNGDIFTTPKEMNGLAFIGCDFQSENGAAIAGSAIVATGMSNLRIENCKFGTKFSDSVLELKPSATRMEQCIIKNNTIIGADKGIEFVTGLAPSSAYTGPIVEGNTIHTAGLCIDDADQAYVRVVRNNCITAADDGTAGVGIIKCNVKTAVDNKVSSAAGQNADFPVPSAIT